MKERTILHSDVNNFFASVECATRPELKDKPVAVTGNPKKRTGIILAKNEIAKKFGVQTGQAIWEAKNLCPDLVTLPPHYALYEEISEKLHELYLNYTDFVEPLGLDECWLDVTDSLKYLNKSGVEIVSEIRKTVKEKFNITVSIGVSFSKIFAKLGSDMKKPDATTEIPFKSFKEKTYHLPLDSIIGIGRRLNSRFSKMNITCIGDFVTLPDDYLKETMGITGVHLKQSLLGERIEPVCNYYELPPPKSIGNGTTTLKDILSPEEVKTTITFLAEKVSARMIKHKVVASTVGVTIKTNIMQKFGRSMKIKPTNEVQPLVEDALKLVDSFWQFNQPIRSIRLRCSNLSDSTVKQISLFDTSKNISETVNKINEKYGHIGIASDMSNFINNSKNPHE